MGLAIPDRVIWCVSQGLGHVTLECYNMGMGGWTREGGHGSMAEGMRAQHSGNFQAALEMKASSHPSALPRRPAPFPQLLCPAQLPCQCQHWEIYGTQNPDPTPRLTCCFPPKRFSWQLCCSAFQPTASGNICWHWLFYRGFRVFSGITVPLSCTLPFHGA